MEKALLNIGFGNTVVAERVLDALCAVGGFFIVLPFAPLPDWMVRSGLVVGAAALVAVVLFVVLVRRKERSLDLIDRILRLVPRYAEMLGMLHGIKMPPRALALLQALFPRRWRLSRNESWTFKE